MPRDAVCLHADALKFMKCAVKTAYGESESTYSGTPFAPYSELVKGAVLRQQYGSLLFFFFFSTPKIASFCTVCTLNLLRVAAHILSHQILFLMIPQLDSLLAMTMTPMMTSLLD